MISSSLPAPYTLNRPHSMQTQNRSHGGRAKSNMIPAHFNREELDVLDHLQGGRKEHNGFRSYNELDKIMSNPHMSENIHHHIRKHHASGGSSYSSNQMHNMASEGRNGDTEMAFIGPHMHQILDRFAGGPTHNPVTGKPEYFSLGNTLSGLWDGIKGAGSTLWNGVKGALPALGGAAGTALGGYFGGPAGAGAGASLGGALGTGLSSLGGSDTPSPQSQGISQNISNGINSYMGGASPSQALGQTVSGIGDQYGGGFGEGLKGFGQGLQSGQGFGQAAQQGGQQAFDKMGGMQGLQSMGRNVLSGAQQGFQNGGVQGALSGGYNSGRNELGSFGRQMMPRPYGRPQAPTVQETYGQQNPYGYGQG